MTKPKIILSLDPASRCSGYAVMDDTGELLDAGLLTPIKTGIDVEYRVPQMLESLIEILDEWQPEIILLELPLEKQRTKNPEMKSGMAIWALAAGAFWGWTMGTCRFVLPDTKIIPISNTLWTKGSPKNLRQQKVMAMYKSYDASKDDGMDVSDSIAMTNWWLRRKKLNELVRTTGPVR